MTRHLRTRKTKENPPAAGPSAPRRPERNEPGPSTSAGAATESPFYYTEQSLADVVDLGDDGLDNVSVFDPDRGPSSVASSLDLDTPQNSPRRDDEEEATAAGRSNIPASSGPCLSEPSSDDSADDDPPPPITTRKPVRQARIAASVKSAKRRRLSASPDTRNRESPKPAATSRPSRAPRRPEAVKPKRGQKSPSPSGSSSSSAEECSLSGSSSSSSRSSSSESTHSQNEPMPKRPFLPPKTPSPVRSEASSRSSSPVADVYDNPVMTPIDFGPPRTPAPVIVRESTPTPGPSPVLKIEKVSPKTPVPRARRGKAKPATPKDAIQGLSILQPIAKPGQSKEHCTPGTIKSLNLVNIMSHKKFTKEWWNPRFNYVTGKNGSGKSAILSGIVAALGGKAHEIGRSKNMKSLINDKENQAKIEIVLNNHYTEQYGSDIKITRKLHRSGKSTFQIAEQRFNPEKNQYERFMRTITRDHLSFVLSKLNIQVENPLAILNQEMSKNFLTSKSDTDLYEYFRKALMLNACESMVEFAQQTIVTAKELLIQKRSLLEELLVKERQLKDDVEQIEKMKECDNTLRQLDDEYAWALVQEKEADVIQVTKKADDMQEKLSIAETELEVLKEELTAYDEKLRQLAERAEKIKRSLDSAKKSRDTKVVELRKVGLNISTLSGEIKACQSAVKSYEANCNFVQQQMRELTDDLVKQRAEAEERANTLTVALNDNETEKHEISVQLAKFERDIRESSENEQRYRDLVADKQKDLDYQTQHLEHAEKKTWSQVDVFGDDMVKLVKMIEKDSNKFKEKPRGPLGACFTVQQETWAPLIEYILEGNLWNFVVSNKEDKNLLQEMINKCFKKKSRSHKVPNITLMQFLKKKMPQVEAERKKCPSKFPSILDAIEILDDDHIVYNWMIDTVAIERILLFKNFEEACQTMIKGCGNLYSKGYSKDGYLFYPDPNYKALVRNMKPTAEILKPRENSGASKKIKRNIERYSGELKRLQEHLQEIVDKKVDLEAQRNNVRIRAEGVHKMNAEIRFQREEALKNVRGLPGPEVSAGTLQEYQTAKKQREDDLVCKEKKLTELQDLYQALQLEKSNLEEEMKSLSKEQVYLRPKMEDAEREKQAHHGKCELTTRVVNETKEQLQQAMQEKKNSRKAVKALTKAASARCGRILDLEISSQEIKNKRDALKNEYERNFEKLGSEKHILRVHNEFERVRQTITRMERESDHIDSLMMIAEPFVQIQKSTLLQNNQEYAIKVQASFRELIRGRYSGELEIDHQERSLACYVNPDGNLGRIKDARRGKAKRKSIMEITRTMSGGERSFTTICFLAACWLQMDCPFFMLDEFDVFMDAKNRSAGQSVLTTAAGAKPNSQFIIFTPLDVMTSGNVNQTIIRLGDPRQGSPKAITASEQDPEEELD